jgi:hypothetical protein
MLLEGRCLGAKSSTVDYSAEIVTCFAMQATEATNSSRLVGFMKLGLETDRTVIDLGGNRQVGYANVRVHVTATVRVHVSETLVPNDAKGLTGQVVDLPSDVVEDGDWRSRIDSRRQWWVDSRGNARAAGSTAGTRRWRPRRIGVSDNGYGVSDNGEAGGAESMSGSGSLAATRRTRSAS